MSQLIFYPRNLYIPNQYFDSYFTEKESQVIGEPLDIENIFAHATIDNYSAPT